MKLGHKYRVIDGQYKGMKGILLGCSENDDLWNLRVPEGTMPELLDIIEVWHYEVELV